ncbi:hypothetical protein VTN77DRAFT_8160 [Rasamsonia byssochlamydoides]|uniref:uncharacterized protein n=1 Tax=Rasamsonia byssochlamydoides TaxID=89139 RepID=UPI003744565F
MASAGVSSSDPGRTDNSLQRKFYPDDICTLKSDPSMVGIVDRTFYDVETHEPLEDSLIVSHVPVPERELMEFLNSGVPPKGYVFVAWSETTQGSSLVREDDIELVDRSLEIGYLVKRHPKDTLSGTVISTSSKYTLQPVAYRAVDPNTGERGPLRFTTKPPNYSESPDQPPGNDLDGPPLLTDVPAEELRDYDDFCEGDYIIYRQKVGIIQQVDRDAVLMLPNHTAVTPLNPYALELPLSLGSKPIVSLPNSNSNESFRSVSSGSGRSDLSVPNDTLFPGQYVRTTQKNLRRGSWISGSPSMECPAEGYIVATPPVDVHVDWLCSNIFSVGLPFFGPTSEVIRASTLQGHATTYDSGKLPTGNSQQPQVKMRSAFTVGDRVRFRDPAGAAVKYRQFDQIPEEQTFDHDLNVFKIVSVKSEAVVLWQDLSVTTETSTSLHKFSGLENEVWPGELVTLKEEIQTVPNPNRNAFEPLAYTFNPARNASILRPKKVGIVQTVNSRERIASVRWYKDPHIELLHEGHVLSPSSVLGELGDEITEVSMYELTTHPGLVKSRGEMVLLVPEKVHQANIPSSPVHASPTAAGPCLLSYLFPVTFTQTNVYLDHIKNVLVQSDWFKRSVGIDTTPLPPRHSVRREDFSLNHPLDWIGHIISLDVDGTITVRLGALQECRDVRVPLEKILMVLDDDVTAGGGGGPMDDMDENYDEWDQVDDGDDYHFFDRVATVLSRTVEYEGGAPLDTANDDDEMWMTEEEDDEPVGTEGAPPLMEIEPPGQSDSKDEDKHDAPPESDSKDAPPVLRGDRVTSSPPNFAILDSSPPADHHFVNSPPTGTATQRLRRIRKEYQILESSLPQGIFARTWESRMDLLRVVIIGPQGTPYEYAPFVIDLHFNSNFPNNPPDTFFHSWTNGMGRINPNMYEDGKICLSILGTWPPKNPDENWSPAKSTVLQILVSIMGLVLVKDPFYNEAGFEAFASEGDSRVESTQYTEKAFVMTRTFIKRALEKPVLDFEDILAWHYLPGPVAEGESARPELLKKAISEARRMIDHYNSTFEKGSSGEQTSPASPFVARLSLGAVVMLRKHLSALEKILSAAEDSVRS